MTLLVYALTSRGAGRLRLSGVGGERLHTIRIGSIDAVVGTVARSPRPTLRILHDYDQVIRAIWKRRAAVLPARFGSMARDQAELEMAVRARRDALRRQLALVRHRAQMTVRIVEEQGEKGQGAGILSLPAEVTARSGTEYLRARARLREVRGFAPVRDAVRRWIKEERAEQRGAVSTIYHLVPRGAGAAYRRAIARAARSARIPLHVSGPWPPYAFAEGW